MARRGRLCPQRHRRGGRTGRGFRRWRRCREGRTDPGFQRRATARAVSVVKFLIEQGIPAKQLAAAGFGEYQPLVTESNQDAYRRNRRIEIKFDQQ